MHLSFSHNHCHLEAQKSVNTESREDMRSFGVRPHELRYPDLIDRGSLFEAVKQNTVFRIFWM